MALLALAGVAGGAAFADDMEGPPALPMKLPPHAQPTERQIEQLPESARAKLSVDTSRRDQQKMDRLYRQLMHEPLSGTPEPGR